MPASKTRPLTVGVDARLVSGEWGGVEQVVIGLAGAMSRFGGGFGDDERYLFLVNPGHAAWLDPYVFGPCSLLESEVNPESGATPEAGTRMESGAPSLRSAGRRSAAGMARGLVKAAIPPSTRAALRRRFAPPPGVPVSDGTIERAGVDVMHFPMQVGFLTDVPTIYAPHDLQHLHLPQFFTKAQIEERERRYRTLCDRAAVVTLMTTWGRDDIVARYGLAPEKVRVVPWAPTTEVYGKPSPDDLAAARTSLRLPDRFALYPAKAWPHKNHTRLVEALAILRRDGLDVPVILTGEQGGLEEPVLAHAESLGVGDLVRFVGFVTPGEMAALYRLAWIMVFPSLFEGWGLPIIEALAAGLPTAASNVTCLPALTAGSAVLFDPNDSVAIAEAVARVWQDEDLRARLAVDGHARAASFSWDRTARIFRACYRLVAGRDLSADDRALLDAPPLV